MEQVSSQIINSVSARTKMSDCLLLDSFVQDSKDCLNQNTSKLPENEVSYITLYSKVRPCVCLITPSTSKARIDLSEPPNCYNKKHVARTEQNGKMKHGTK